MRSDGRPFISDLGIDTPDEPVVSRREGDFLLLGLEEPYPLAVEGETRCARKFRELVEQVNELNSQKDFDAQKDELYEALCDLKNSDHAPTRDAVNWIMFVLCGASVPRTGIHQSIELRVAKERMRTCYERNFLVGEMAKEKGLRLSGIFVGLESLRKELLLLKKYAEAVVPISDDEEKMKQMLLDPEFGLIVELAQARKLLLDDLRRLCRRQEPQGVIGVKFKADVEEKLQQFAKTYRTIMGERGTGEYSTNREPAINSRDRRRYDRRLSLKRYGKEFSSSTTYALKAIGQTLLNLLQMATGVGLLVGIGRVATGHSFGVNGTEIFPKYNALGKSLRPLRKRSQGQMKAIAEKTLEVPEEKSGERQEGDPASPVHVR